MIDIIHRIGIKSPVSRVLDALTTLEGLSNWWTQDVQGDTHPDGKIEFTFRSAKGDIIGQMVMQVQTPSAQKDVHWRCVDGPPEWIGTDITFQLSLIDGQTILIFGHRNWREAVEFTAHCSMKWAVFLLSLREYVESGKGKPSPRDIKIDNWN
jgi:uncharacterized protein YndB with AHSA1/START domain